MLAILGIGLLGWGCRPPVAREVLTLIVTQVPRLAGEGKASHDALDRLFPSGSRVAWMDPAREPDRVIVLSAGLWAAGGPALEPDGEHVLFAGKASSSSAWQIYRASLRSGKPEALTSMPGGAMAPAWLPRRRFVFASPVPVPEGPGSGPGNLASASTSAAVEVPALYTLSLTGGPPTRLTFGQGGAADPTVLADGRILFVSTVPAAGGTVPPATSLFTINNDGTEVTPYAAQHDAPAGLRRPRESADGRVLFVATPVGALGGDGRIEQVLTARPFRSRAETSPVLGDHCRSVEPLADGSMLVTRSAAEVGGDPETLAIFRVGHGDRSPGEAIFSDPAWSTVEAISAGRPAPPRGRLSNVDLTRSEAVLLCLDANFTDQPSAPRETAGSGGPGTRVRLVRSPGAGRSEVLGETDLEADGSFVVRVPVDVPLGVELLDRQGVVVRRCPPAFWLRPGENRACVGCHEPHNRAPENVRPLAVLKSAKPMLPVSPPARAATGSNGARVGDRGAEPPRADKPSGLAVAGAAGGQASR